MITSDLVWGWVFYPKSDEQMQGSPKMTIIVLLGLGLFFFFCGIVWGLGLFGFFFLGGGGMFGVFT